MREILTRGCFRCSSVLFYQPRGRGFPLPPWPRPLAGRHAGAALLLPICRVSVAAAAAAAEGPAALPLPRPSHPVPAGLISSLGIAAELAFHRVSGLRATGGGLAPGYVCHSRLFRISDSVTVFSGTTTLLSSLVIGFATSGLENAADIV